MLTVKSVESCIAKISKKISTKAKYFQPLTEENDASSLHPTRILEGLEACMAKLQALLPIVRGFAAKKNNDDMEPKFLYSALEDLSPEYKGLVMTDLIRRTICDRQIAKTIADVSANRSVGEEQEVIDALANLTGCLTVNGKPDDVPRDKLGERLLGLSILESSAMDLQKSQDRYVYQALRAVFERKVERSVDGSLDTSLYVAVIQALHFSEHLPPIPPWFSH